MSHASATDAPSLTSLLKALAFAIGLAVVLLVLVVLPAELNIDVTGFGGAIGVTALSAPHAEPAPTEPVPPADSAPQPVSNDAAAMVAVGEATRDDETVVELPPGKGLEYKFRIRAGEKLTYSWKSDAGGLIYDFHGEPAGAPKNVFESYASGKASSVKGVLTTPFDGTHGWYWKNMSQRPIKVTLTTSGAYEVLGLRRFAAGHKAQRSPNMNRWTTIALTVALTVVLAMGLAARAAAHDPVAEAEYLLEEKLKSPWLTSNGFEIDFNRALGLAGRTGKPIFAYFTLSYMDVDACDELEHGVLSTPEFKKFGESVVLFTHVNSGLGGDYANLLREKGGTEVPAFLVMDDLGNVAAKVTESNDVPSFEKAVKAAAKFIALRNKADKTLDEKVYVLTLDMDLGNLKPLLAKERSARLGDLNDAQTEQFDAAMLRLEIWTAASDVRGSSKRARAAGKLFAEMWAAGREPTTDDHARSFFTLMLDHAEAAKDATLFKRALDKLEGRFGEKPDSKDFFEEQAERLKRLKGDRDEAVEQRDDDAAK